MNMAKERVRLLADEFRPHSAEPLIPASFGLGPAWYAVYTGLQAERRAVMGLQSLGFQAYLPEETRMVRHARKQKEVQRPMLARYCFVRFDINADTWWPIRRVDGVEYILGNDGIPKQVSDQVLGIVRAAERNNGVDIKTMTGSDIGDELEILAGPFKGFYSVLVGVDSTTKKVEAMLSLLGKEMIVKYSLADVRAK